MEDHKFDLINVDFVAVQRYLFSSSTSRCTVVDDSSAAGFPFDISDNTIFAFLMACCCKVTNVIHNSTEALVLGIWHSDKFRQHHGITVPV